MKQANLNVILSLLAAISLSSCSWFSQEPSLGNVDTTNIYQLEGVQVATVRGRPNKPLIGALRAKALQEIAMGVGAQAGLAYASENMNIKIKKDGPYLDTIFNFNGMMLTHGVLPPVLVEGDYTLNLDDPTTLRVADRTYQIVQQARFATTAPHWREYLYLNFSKPSLPDRSLLPRDAIEQKIWKKAIRVGWEKGIEQAYNIFHQNLSRLKRDYNGMILYRKLLQNHMISPPFVARTELGITGNGSDMRVNDQVLRIVALPELQTNGHNWKAVVVKK